MRTKFSDDILEEKPFPYRTIKVTICKELRVGNASKGKTVTTIM